MENVRDQVTISDVLARGPVQIPIKKYLMHLGARTVDQPYQFKMGRQLILMRELGSILNKSVMRNLILVRLQSIQILRYILEFIVTWISSLLMKMLQILIIKVVAWLRIQLLKKLIGPSEVCTIDRLCLEEQVLFKMLAGVGSMDKQATEKKVEGHLSSYGHIEDVYLVCIK